MKCPQSMWGGGGGGGGIEFQAPSPLCMKAVFTPSAVVWSAVHEFLFMVIIMYR